MSPVAELSKTFSVKWLTLVIYFCYEHSLVSWGNQNNLAKIFLHGDPKSSKSRQEGLEFLCKLRTKLKYMYGFENWELARFQKYKQIEFTLVSSPYCLSLEREKWMSEYERQDPETKKWKETKRRAKKSAYSNSPSYQPGTFHPTSNSPTIFPLKLQSKTHCRCDIIFPDNWTLRVNDFLSFQRETISFCLM